MTESEKEKYEFQDKRSPRFNTLADYINYRRNEARQKFRQADDLNLEGRTIMNEASTLEEQLKPAALSSNGRTDGFEPSNLGSSPSEATK